MLDGKVIVLTGASRGLGRQAAKAIVEAGGRVALLARASAELEEVAEGLGINALACACDVSNPEDVRVSIDAAASHFGGINALVNNAAVGGLFRIEDMTDEHIQKEIGINLMGPIYCIRQAVPHLSKSNGHVVNISSIGVNLPFDMMSLYATTKGGLETLSLAMQFELRTHGIRVSTLRLGGLVGEKGITRDWDKEKRKEYVRAAEESGRMMMAGGFTTFSSAASALLTILTAPPDGNFRLVEFAGL